MATMPMPLWRRGVVVKALGISKKLIYTWGPITTGIGDRLRAGKPPQYVTKSPRPTQPPSLSGMGTEYQQKVRWRSAAAE